MVDVVPEDYGSATLASGASKGQPSPARPPDATVRSVAAAAQLACVLEVSAEKPGNVTPTRDFGDMTYEDMVRSAIALGPELAQDRGVGETVLAIVRATRLVTAANTNLGIALLLAPLAKAARGGGPLRERLGATLRALDVVDARAAYEAIRLANAGGLQEEVEHDVRAEPTIGLREAMAAAADRDSIASEYVTDYALTFEIAVPALAVDIPIRDAIVDAHLRLLDAAPDTLIARKRGADAAARVSAGAREVLAAGGVRSAAGREALQRFDASLRSPDNALNPGTTADLVTAAIFVALVEGMV
jgi:triphosphoribosyl-dephospho-CoA synthase